MPLISHFSPFRHFWSCQNCIRSRKQEIRVIWKILCAKSKTTIVSYVLPTSEPTHLLKKGKFFMKIYCRNIDWIDCEMYWPAWSLIIVFVLYFRLRKTCWVEVNDISFTNFEFKQRIALLFRVSILLFTGTK